MNIIIKKGKTGRAEVSPFMLPDSLKLHFKVEGVGYDLSEAFIVLKNGTAKGKYRLTQDFEVPDKFLFEGYLYMSIDVYLKGEKNYTIQVYPIKLVEANGETVVYDVIQSLEERISHLETFLPKNIF